jgi:hypothetical protein
VISALRKWERVANLCARHRSEAATGDAANETAHVEARERDVSVLFSWRNPVPYSRQLPEKRDFFASIGSSVWSKDFVEPD